MLRFYSKLVSKVILKLLSLNFFGIVEVVFVISLENASLVFLVVTSLVCLSASSFYVGVYAFVHAHTYQRGDFSCQKISIIINCVVSCAVVRYANDYGRNGRLDA